MRILLTGASGFVGRYVQEEVACYALENDAGTIDLRDTHLLRESIASISPDAVIHLAAQSFVPESFDKPMDTYEVNFFGTLNLLSALKVNGFSGRMLYVGSSDMYGVVPAEYLPIDEVQLLKPRSPYAVSKVAAEALCYQWSQTEEFDIVFARPFNHIGPGQSDRFVISNFAKQIIEIKLGRRESVLFVGDVDVSRDFTDVRDIIKAYVSLLGQGLNGETYNICSGEERTIQSLLSTMLDLAKVDAEIQRDVNRLRLSEQRRVQGDFSKLRKDTGWSPTISMKKTLQDILDYWEELLS